MRLALLLLALTAFAAADEIYPKQGKIALEDDVKILEEADGKIHYIDKSLRKRSISKAMVGRVVKKRSSIHEFQDRYDAAETCAAVLELIAWARKEKFHKTIFEPLYQRALEFDPDNEEANLALGRVQYKGEWMKPAVRDLRIEEDKEEEMRAKGLVRWEDRWVTPEDKVKLEQGLRKHDGRWMTPDEIRRAKGYVKHEGRWVKKADLEVLRLMGSAKQDTGLGDQLKLFQTDHYAVMGDLPEAQLQTLGETMERLFAEWVRLFPEDADSDILDGKHRLFVFKKNRPYQKLVRARFERQKKAENWSTGFAKQEEKRMKLRLRETSFWDVQPVIVSGHVQMPDPFEGLKAHCVHFGANVLVTRHKRLRFTSWWLNEGLAYYLEKRVTGTIQTYNADVGGGAYADQGPVENNKANPWLDAQQWQTLLGGLTRTGRDPKLDQLKSKVLYGSKNRMGAKDLAKSLSVVSYLIADDARKFAEFVADCKEGSGSELEREVSAAIKHYGSYAKIEAGWKAYALNGFRLAR